ncbi:MAG: hypothetical protein ACI9F9_000864 [Candidatus Paceibacteria bacterium]|jgi:hypothetical protein
MRTTLIYAILALGAGLTQQLNDTPESGEQNIVWHSELEGAEILARKTGKPLLAIFR